MYLKNSLGALDQSCGYQSTKDFKENKRYGESYAPHSGNP